MRLELRHALQADLRDLDHREAENVDPLPTFLPLLAHRMALRPETVVVRGGRGAGKSALFLLLRKLETSKELTKFFGELQLQNDLWVDAFSQTGTSHPSVESIDAFAGRADDAALRTFWMTHLLRRLGQASVLPQELREEATRLVPSDDIQTIERWVDTDRIGAISAALDSIERELLAKKKLVFAAYDHLDRIGILDPVVRSRFLRALLALWLSLSNRYSWLRAKIFLREDLFAASEQSFPDATKLRARSVSLEWEVEDLYRVVVRHLASRSEGMRIWLRGVEELALEDRGEFGWMPGPMPEDVQKAFVGRLTDELMGRGVKKGYTYRWIPNRLQDAHVRIVPRSILTLLGVAARTAVSRSFAEESHRLITRDDLVEALPETSQQRVAEIGEEAPLVRQLENLRGLRVMIEAQKVAERLGRPMTVGEPAPDGRAVMEELIRLGVLDVRRDGRIDVPDIYRYGYGILRQGGVRRPK